MTTDHKCMLRHCPGTLSAQGANVYSLLGNILSQSIKKTLQSRLVLHTTVATTARKTLGNYLCSFIESSKEDDLAHKISLLGFL